MKSNTAPSIQNIAGKKAILERRVDHLKRKLERSDYSDTPSAEFDRAEIPALEDALRCMTYVQGIN